MDKRVELLAPAGNPEKLEIAIHYGADAVYLAGKDFSLRNFSGNFTLKEMERAVLLAHGQGVKVYVACNAFARNSELQALREYMKAVAALEPDALIIADPGVFSLARQAAPGLDIHISTQANTTNLASALFWKGLGAARIIAARELPLEDIREIVLHGAVEVECFVHGAMCISYSGRCLLSAFLTGRDANRGLCSHPCRWKYRIEEETRPGQFFPVAEDNRGLYIFNSRDLCMIRHIPELIRAGVSSLKIEGRMKGINYLASVVKVYREAIDAYYENPEHFSAQPAWEEELSRISNRQYCTGFYFGGQEAVLPNHEDVRPDAIHRFAAKITAAAGTLATLDVRNKIFSGQAVEILPRKGPAIPDVILALTSPEGAPLEAAQPNSVAQARLSEAYQVNDLVRLAQESAYSR